MTTSPGMLFQTPIRLPRPNLPLHNNFIHTTTPKLHVHNTIPLTPQSSNPTWHPRRYDSWQAPKNHHWELCIYNVM